MTAHGHDQHPDQNAGQAPDPASYWESRYAGAERMWSGRVTETVRDLAESLRPGRSLDLGCGEGADVVHLAGLGWEATGIDLSPTAVARAGQAAREQGPLAGQARFLAVDLTDAGVDWGTGYDLVTASFLQSPLPLDRQAILRRAVACVGRGGHLLVTSHAAPPPWAADHHHEHGHDGDGNGEGPRMTTPEEDLAALGLPGDARETAVTGDEGAAGSRWTVHVAEIRERRATAPDGQPATLQDSVVLAQRTG